MVWAVVLTGVLLATSCQSKPPPERPAVSESSFESITDPVLRETAVRASNATARVLQEVSSGAYRARHASAFYIGNDEWVTPSG